MATADCSVVVVVAADFQWKTRTKNGVFSFFVFFFSGFSSSKPNCVGKQEEIDVAGVASWERRFELPKEKNFCRHGKQKKNQNETRRKQKKNISSWETPRSERIENWNFLQKKKKNNASNQSPFEKEPVSTFDFFIFFCDGRWRSRFSRADFFWGRKQLRKKNEWKPNKTGSDRGKRIAGTALSDVPSGLHRPLIGSRRSMSPAWFPRHFVASFFILFSFDFGIRWRTLRSESFRTGFSISRLTFFLLSLPFTPNLTWSHLN